MSTALHRRLDSARARLASAGQAAVERELHLRGELAAAGHVREQSAAALRLSAAQLERGVRGTGRGLARLLERAEGEAVPVTYVPPVSPVGLQVRPGPSPWGRVLRRALALAAVLLCLAPAPAWARRTPLSERAIGQALAAAHVDVFGSEPSAERLLVARAQVGLEVGRGRWAYCNNLGNIGARKSRRVPSCLTKGGFRVRSYSSPRAAARAYWRLASVRKALPWFDRGDAHGAAYALKRAGYYTAPAEVYAARMAAVHRELVRDVVERDRR